MLLCSGAETGISTGEERALKGLSSPQCHMKLVPAKRRAKRRRELVDDMAVQSAAARSGRDGHERRPANARRITLSPKQKQAKDATPPQDCSFFKQP